jgi:hypothetical protein
MTTWRLAVNDPLVLGPSDSGTVTNNTTIITDTQAERDVDLTATCTVGANETATITIRVLNSGTEVFTDSDSGSDRELSVEIDEFNVTFDELQITHSGDSSADWQYQLLEVQNGELIRPVDGLFNVPELRSTANPFADFGVARIDDFDGTQYDKFPQGTRVDFEVAPELDPDNQDFTTRLQGFIVERREIEENGADQLEIEVYSLDQLLRGTKVSQSTKGKTISTVLENIITNDTAVEWNASLVEIENDITLLRELRGEPVETALLYCTFKSSNERISVTENIEFVFEEKETTPAPRNVDSTEWFYVDQPEEGREVINECRVWYNDGEETVTVENGAQKLQLENALGLNDPYSRVKEVQRQDVDELNVAKAIGNQILEDRATTTPITVQTFGLETVQPGQVITVDIPSKGIEDTDFEIAGVTYNWGQDTTDLLLVEQTGYQDDLLVRVVDAIERVELLGINRDADGNRITDTLVEALISIDGSLNGTSYSQTRFTNTGRNKLRDAWIGESNLDITDIAIGDDNSSINRTNTSLQNQTNTGTASEILVGDTRVDYQNSFGDTSAQEVGLFDNSGDLIARAITDSSVSDTDLTATIELSVDDNADVTRGVFTTDGQIAVRDMIADNSPDKTTQYAYGQDGTQPAESDTSLGNESIKIDLTETLIQSANTTSEFENVFNTSEVDYAITTNDSITLEQTGYFAEYETAIGGNTINSSDYSGGAGKSSDINGQTLSVDITPEIDIPQSEVGLQVRREIDQGDLTETQRTYSFNGWTDQNTISGSVSLGWADFSNVYDGGDLSAGTTYNFETTFDDNGEANALIIDCIAVYDQRAVSNETFDNTTDANDALEDPPLYPESVTVSGVEAETDRNVTAANYVSTWTDTSENQAVRLSNDGGSTFKEVTNSATGSVTFDGPETGVQSELQLSYYTSDSTTTPTIGDSGQTISSWELYADVTTLRPYDLGVGIVEGVVRQGEITGDVLQEAGQLASDDTLLTRSIFSRFEVFSDMTVRSSEKTGFYNS